MHRWPHAKHATGGSAEYNSRGNSFILANRSCLRRQCVSMPTSNVKRPICIRLNVTARPKHFDVERTSKRGLLWSHPLHGAKGFAPDGNILYSSAT